MWEKLVVQVYSFYSCLFVDFLQFSTCFCNYSLLAIVIHTYTFLFFFTSLSLHKIIKSRNDNIILLLLCKFDSHKHTQFTLFFFHHRLHLTSYILSLFVICLCATFHILYITEHCVNVYSFNFVNEKTTGVFGE